MTKDIKIRKVKILSGRLHEQCKEMGLDSGDLVLVTTTYPEDKLPEYEIEKVEGSPTEFLKDRFLASKENRGVKYEKSPCGNYTLFEMDLMFTYDQLAIICEGIEELIKKMERDGLDTTVENRTVEEIGEYLKRIRRADIK